MMKDVVSSLDEKGEVAGLMIMEVSRFAETS